MVTENTPRITLLISLIIHLAILACLPLFKDIPLKNKLKKLEITYKSTSGAKGKKERGGISKELLSVKQKSLPKAPLPQDFPEIKQQFKFDLSKLIKPKETIALPRPHLSTRSQKKPRISLKNLPVEMSKDPAYLGYLDIIRKKIQDRVYYYSDRYFYFDNPRIGKVFVSFIVSSDGTIGEITIQDAKSSRNKLLRKISLKAIENASPFEKFPKDLNYNERVFNLEISFEIE